MGIGPLVLGLTLSWLLVAYSDENRHQFQSNVGHYFQRKPCHLFRLNHSQSFHSKVGH